MTYSSIFVRLSSPTGKEIVGQVIVREEYALATFTEKKLAKKVYDIELKKGEDVYYNEKEDMFIQHYKGWTKEAIIKHLRKKFEDAGGTFTGEVEL